MQQEGCADKQNVLDELEGLKTALRIQNNCPALKNLDISYHGENVVRPVFGNGSFKPKIAMCAAMSNQYIFDYTGQIYKCWWGMGNPDYRVGSFSLLGYSIHRDLEDLYRLRNVTTIPKCRQCRFRFVCGGGCTGRLSRRDFALGETICPDFENILTFMIRHLYLSGEKPWSVLVITPYYVILMIGTLAVNLLYGTIDELDEDLFKRLTASELDSISEKTVEALNARHHIQSESNQQLHMLASLPHDSPRVQFFIPLTNLVQPCMPILLSRGPWIRQLKISLLTL